MSDMNNSPEIGQTFNLVTGLIIMSLRMDAIMAEFRPLAKEAANGGRPEGLAGRAPELLYLIGAKEALDSAIACLDDPMAGMMELEENVGKMRFRTQLAQMEREG